MRYIHPTSTNPYFNLAAEEYMLKHFSENVFMLWQSKPAVIVGRHQNVWAEVNLDFAKEQGIELARRFSGGGAVYHDAGNLNFTFIETNSNPNFDMYGQRMIDFLHTIGIEAQIDKRRALAIGGLKISGSAQAIYRNRVMYHATLLFSSDLTMLFSALNSKPDQLKDSLDSRLSAAVPSVKSPVTNILNQLAIPISLSDFKLLVMRFFIGEEGEICNFSTKEIQLIEELAASKYSTSQWIFNTAAPK